VVEEVLQSDLSQYEEESGKSQDEEEGEQVNNKDNGQALIEDESKDIGNSCLSVVGLVW